SHASAAISHACPLRRAVHGSKPERIADVTAIFPSKLPRAVFVPVTARASPGARREPGGPMRVFHSLVFDENIETSAATSTIDASWNAQLGRPDKLTIFAVTDTVSNGTTSPTLNVQIQESPDQVHWTNKQAAPELTSTISTASNSIAVGRDPGTTPSAAFIRL